MGMRFFHLPKGKHFNIPYRFHDPEKEEREKREARIKSELGMEEREAQNKVTSSRQIKGSFKSRLGHQRYAQNQRKRSNMRIFIILILMALLAYLFLK